MIGCNLTTSSDDDDGKKKKEKNEKKNLFFSYVVQCLRVVHIVHDNDVKSAQKISQLCICMLHRMNESSRLSITVFITKKTFFFN